MEHINLLATSFACVCGKQHTVPTRYLIYKEGAYDSICSILLPITSGRRWLVVADKRTYQAAGKAVESVLHSGGVQVSCFFVPDIDGESPSADESTMQFVRAQAPEADLYIAVGSGVINDLVKWVAYLEKKPYVTVPTAASMNGYASANVAATIKGLKVLFHADACLAAFADPVVLRSAPVELTGSGLGDVLAKSVSSADWKLNHFLFGDYYCQFAVDLLKDLEPVYLNNPHGVRNREPAALKALFEALFFSSIAMTITGTSSPASGAEHLISHTLDMIAFRDAGKHDFHGRQVGVCSILMAALYEQIMSLEKPVFKEVPASVDEKFWGALSPVVEKEYKNKQMKIKKAAEFLSIDENWLSFQRLISPTLVSANNLKNCLSQAGAAHRFHDLRDNGRPLEKDKFVVAVINANQMRERFTILDIAVMLGIIPGQVDQLIKRWVTE